MCVPLACGLEGFSGGFDSLGDQDPDEVAEPVGVARGTDLELLSDPQGPAYGVDVVAGPNALLVTWSQNRRYRPDPGSAPDVFALRMSPEAWGDEGIVEVTPYIGAQVEAVPLSSDVGFSVLWHDDAVAGIPDGRIVIKNLDPSSLHGHSDPIPTSAARTHQRMGAAATVGDRALVVYTSTQSVDATSHASLIDLTGGTIIRELDLPAARWLMPRSVTAGAYTFLVLHLEGDVGELHALFATVYDLEGDAVWGPKLISDRVPESSRPIEAAYHAGWFFIPTFKDRQITVDRPCCQLCGVIQEPTCTIRDFDTYVTALDEDELWLAEPWCLDCRIDTGIAVPLTAGTPDGVYFYWDGFVARATLSELPQTPTWRRVEFDDENIVISREIHALEAIDGHVALVGRQRDLMAVPPDDFSAFVAWLDY